MELETPENKEMPHLADVSGRTSIKNFNSRSSTVKIDSVIFGKVLMTIKSSGAVRHIDSGRCFDVRKSMVHFDSYLPKFDLSKPPTPVLYTKSYKINTIISFLPASALFQLPG
jgi:hypothetical protein